MIEEELLKRLINDLLDLDDLLLGMDSGGAVCEMHLNHPPLVKYDKLWMYLESDDWHLHLPLENVSGVQIVESSDHGHENIPKVFYVRFGGASRETLMRFYFSNPWLNEKEEVTEFQKHKLTIFERFRDKYVACAGVEGVTRDKTGSYTFSGSIKTHWDI